MSQIDILKDFFPLKKEQTLQAALSMNSNIEIASMILTSNNKKTLNTLNKKSIQIYLYQQIENVIFDCENIFDYLGFLDCINLSLVNKTYNQKHNQIVSKYDPDKKIENIFIKLFNKQNKNIDTENNQKEDQIKNQITTKLIKLFKGPKIDLFPKEFSNFLKLYYKYILTNDYLTHEFIFEKFANKKNPDRIILLHNYLGMGWFKTIACFYKLKQPNKYFICNMGGSNGWDRQDNYKKYKNTTTESVELLSLHNAFKKLTEIS